MAEKRLPWFKFYPADWRDPRLRLCSLAARGLWIDLITYAHDAEPYGHVVISSTKPSTEQIASLVGRPVKEVRAALQELRQVGVYSETSDGIIYSRRMVRDKAKHLKDQENGRKGGNPWVKGGVNHPVDTPLNALEARGQRLEARDIKTTTVLNAAREEPVNNLNGKSSLASLASAKKLNGHTNGKKFTPQQKREAWVQKVSNFLYRTLSDEQATEIIFGHAAGNKHFVKKFEEASERMNAETSTQIGNDAT